MSKYLKPIFFAIDNLKDKCSFCQANAKLIKSMTTGKNICYQCAEMLQSELLMERLKEDMKLLEDKS